MFHLHKNKKIFLIFILIIILASFLRIFELNKVPNGLFIDEISEAYDAYSVLKTGKDRHGQPFPLIFKSMNDYVLPFYNYSIIPFILLFDLNEWSTRLPATIFGILSIVLIFFLVRRMFNEKIALLTSFFFAVSPWHIQFSRIAFPVIGFSFLFIFGFFLIYKGLENKKYLIFSAIPFALSFYTYHISKLFIPLFILGFLFIYRKTFLKYKKELLIFFIVLFLLSVPAIYTTFFGEGLTKFNETIIFSKNNDDNLLKEEQENYILYFFKNYFGILSPDFLFFKGDSNLRHSIKGFGQLYLFHLPLILFGFFLFFKKRAKVHKLIFYWLLIFPIASSLTNQGVHAVRTFIALPLFQIISAYALFNLFLFFKKKRNICYFILILFLIFAVFNIGFYLKNYFVDYPRYSGDLFEGGLREGFDYLKSVENNYDTIYITYSIYHSDIYALFFTKYDPREYQIDGLDNSKYSICAPQICYKTNSIYLVKPYDMNKFRDFKKEKIIYYPNGEEAFWIVELS